MTAFARTLRLQSTAAHPYRIVINGKDLGRYANIAATTHLAGGLRRQGLDAAKRGIEVLEATKRKASQ